MDGYRVMPIQEAAPGDVFVTSTGDHVIDAPHFAVMKDGAPSLIGRFANSIFCAGGAVKVERVRLC